MHRNPADDIAEVFALHERRLGAFLGQITDRQLADDLLQETFLTALRERERLGEVENVEAWLFAVARNRALAALRSKRRRLALAVRLRSVTDETSPDPEAAVAARNLLIRNTEPDERILLVLAHVHGFDTATLAGIYGCAPVAMRQRLTRARKRFVERVRAAEPDFARAQTVQPAFAIQEEL